VTKMTDLQSIFSNYAHEYRKNNKLPLKHLKVMGSIESCRTMKLGGHVYKCDSCGEVKVSYNSCRDRHCPKCQGLARESWLMNRKSDMMPIRYFHVVFTMPQELNDIALRNQKVVYDLLFKAVSETLLQVSRDPKFLGAQIGFMSILHTWGQNLMHHPHIHCVVSGGGLSIDGLKWIHSRKKFFVPVKVLSKKFKGKFLAFLKEAYYTRKLKMVGNIDYLTEKYEFQNLVDSLYQKNWVVYCKRPFKNAYCALEYLGRYTHKVAISNSRLEYCEDGLVVFKWKDYKDKNKIKHMTLNVNEFIRRFLFHVLPDRFVKIRYFGIQSNRNRNLKLKLCKKLTGAATLKAEAKLSTEELILKLTGKDISRCACCNEGRLICIGKVNPRVCSPPIKSKIS
jgi:hypothetical protein